MSQIYALTVVVLLMISQGVTAKRGCSAFGHSCFGGHGKRSSDVSSGEINNQLMARHQMGQEETPPHPVYPHSGYSGPYGDDIIPVRDGGYDREDNVATKMETKYLRDMIKHWIDNYRRSQQSYDDVFETL